MVVDDGNGSTDVAVVELFSPVYDAATGGVTYEVEMLANWQAELGVGLHEAPSDLAAIEPSFGAAHLFIDDCSNADIYCMRDNTTIQELPNQEMCWNYSRCMPCEPFGHVQPDRCQTQYYWVEKCNELYPRYCEGKCHMDWDRWFSGSLCD